MPSLSDDQTFFLPRFAVASETRSSARYHWSCANRGPEPFVIVQWTQTGSGVFRYEGRDHPVPPGAAFVAIVPEDASYRFEAGAAEPWRFGWINFYGAVSLQLWRALRMAVGPVFGLAPESEAGRSLRQLIAHVVARRFVDRYDASGAGYAFFMTLSRQLDAPSSALPQSGRTAGIVRRIAGNRLTGTTVGVKSLASEFRVSREHFSRVFKSQHGESPGKFLRLQRLEAAREMLTASSLPLREVALRCGFTSPRHLTDAFRTRYGQPPVRCRPSPDPSGQ